MKTKHLFLCFTIALFSVGSYAQTTSYDQVVKVGDELVIGPLTDGNYQFINVPRKNFIIKRGGIANYGSLANNKVVVVKLKKDRDENTIVTFKRSDNTKFFNRYKTLSADLNKAIANGELKWLDPSGRKTLAR